MLSRRCSRSPRCCHLGRQQRYAAAAEVPLAYISGTPAVLGQYSRRAVTPPPVLRTLLPLMALLRPSPVATARWVGSFVGPRGGAPPLRASWQWPHLAARSTSDAGRGGRMRTASQANSPLAMRGRLRWLTANSARHGHGRGVWCAQHSTAGVGGGETSGQGPAAARFWQRGQVKSQTCVAGRMTRPEWQPGGRARTHYRLQRQANSGAARPSQTLCTQVSTWQLDLPHTLGRTTTHTAQWEEQPR